MLDEDDESRDVRVGGEIELRFHKPERPFPDVVDDPVLDFLVTARGRWVSVEVSVRTLDGDGLDAFLAELAEDFRGWKGVRTWRSLERDLTLSARHAGHSVRLTWGMHGRPPSEEWHFETTTDHAPGEDMRNLAAEMSLFLQSEPRPYPQGRAATVNGAVQQRSTATGTTAVERHRPSMTGRPAQQTSATVVPVVRIERVIQ